MSNESDFKPPRKKPSIFWWLGGAFLVLLLIFLFQLLGPSPPITLSRNTTYITEPLHANGMPDYERNILERLRNGVTPQNNAAALIWPTLWPGEAQPTEYAIIAAELGLNSIPAQRDALIPIYKYLDGIVRSQQTVDEAETAIASDGSRPAANSPQFVSEDAAEKLNDRILGVPWTTAEFPLFAKWIERNQKQLDRLVEASHRPRCYFPSVTLIDDKPDIMFNMSLAGDQGSREVGRSLMARVMWNLGENRPKESWSDLSAIYRTGPLVAQGETLVNELIGIALTNMAVDGTITMLSENPPADVARQMLEDLSKLEKYQRAADLIDRSERFSFIDCVIAISRGEFDPKALDPNGHAYDDLTYLHRFNIDWNAVLRKGNEYYDRLSAAFRLHDPVARHAALARVNADIDNAAARPDAGSYFSAVVNPSARTDLVASQMIGLLMPAIIALDVAENRANTKLGLVQIAAALAVYHAEHTAYPTKLDELVPSLLDKLPPDVFGNQAWLYQRTTDGYLLYSAGADLGDCHGSNDRDTIFEGYRLDGLPESAAAPLRDKIPSGADDISIRIPRVPTKLPTPPTGSEKPESDH
jgi:hypothetical protein